MEDEDKVKEILRANEAGEILGYRFSNIDILKRAFTRKAFAKEAGERPEGGAKQIEHQRPLATLGDAILKAALADLIFHSGSKSSDQITKEKVDRERNSTIAKVAERRELWRLTMLGGSEEAKGLEKEESILADTIEAVIGAMYIDTGCNLSKTKEVIARWF